MSPRRSTREKKLSERAREARDSEDAVKARTSARVERRQVRASTGPARAQTQTGISRGSTRGHHHGKGRVGARRRARPAAGPPDAMPPIPLWALSPSSDIQSPTLQRRKIQSKPKRKTIINSAPVERLDVYVCGQGPALGLGTAPKDTYRRHLVLNPNLGAEDVGIVHLAAGFCHAMALTHDGKVLTWGSNTGGVLGRDTRRDDPTHDSDDSQPPDENDQKNHLLYNPRNITFPQGTVITQLAAGETISLALTDDGHVYGWGTFTNRLDVIGFKRDMRAGSHRVIEEIEGRMVTRIVYHGMIMQQDTPFLYPELQNIRSIACGDNHCLALDKAGSLWSWGINVHGQLGRKISERHGLAEGKGLIPARASQVKFASIYTGTDHSFGIDQRSRVYGWGSNGSGQLAIPSNSLEDVVVPTLVDCLNTEAEINPVIMLAGGDDTSIGLSRSQEILTWGFINENLGKPLYELMQNRAPDDPCFDLELVNPAYPELGQLPRALIQPTTLFHPLTHYIARGNRHCLALTDERGLRRQWAWGAGTEFQLGNGFGYHEGRPVRMEGASQREMTWAGAGDNFSIVAGPAAEGAAAMNAALLAEFTEREAQALESARL